MRSEILALNGMPDHIHIVVSIQPIFAVAEWVKLVKGVSSRDLNAALPSLSSKFRWQSGYGVFTISPRNVNVAIQYVERQKEHHLRQTTVVELENAGDE
jgi:putative transposase